MFLIGSREDEFVFLIFSDFFENIFLLFFEKIKNGKMYLFDKGGYFVILLNGLDFLNVVKKFLEE